MVKAMMSTADGTLVPHQGSSIKMHYIQNVCFTALWTSLKSQFHLRMSLIQQKKMINFLENWVHVCLFNYVPKWAYIKPFYFCIPQPDGCLKKIFQQLFKLWIESVTSFMERHFFTWKNNCAYLGLDIWQTFCQKWIKQAYLFKCYLWQGCQ